MPWRAMFNLKSTKAVVLTPQRPKGAITPLTPLTPFTPLTPLTPLTPEHTITP